MCTHAAPVDVVFSVKEMIAALARARQLFLKELKIKMAVDAGRKWLPREKVMPGKPGGDDGDAHALPTNERAVRSPVSPPLPVKETGTALPPMGASGE